VAHRYELKLVVKETAEDISVLGEFEDSEFVVLDDFVKYSEDLLSTMFIQKGDAGELTIKWDQLVEPGSMTVTTRLPDWDDVMAFLHRLRPFVLQDEPTSFFRIHNLLVKNFGHPRLTEIVGQYHFLYSGKRQRLGLQFRSNDVLINSEKMLLDWLNSHEYHKNREKKNFIAELHRVMPLDASKVLFLRLLIDKAQAVFALAALIRVALGQQKDLRLKLWPKPIGLNAS
jgi:hypothetical protein